MMQIEQARARRRGRATVPALIESGGQPAPGLRFVEVLHDALGARPGDLWVVAPTDRYDGEGLYAVRSDTGAEVVCSVDAFDARAMSVRIGFGAPYLSHELPIAGLKVVGRVVAHLHVLDRRALDAARRRGVVR